MINKNQYQIERSLEGVDKYFSREKLRNLSPGRLSPKRSPFRD